MLHILLLILKIIGIILGTLLAVLLIGFCLALFVPVHYRIEARRTEAEGAPPIEAEGSVTWLLHFVNVRFRYPADVYLRARLFVITVFRLPPQKKAEGNKRGGEHKKDGKGMNEKKEEYEKPCVESGRELEEAKEQCQENLKEEEKQNEERTGESQDVPKRSIAEKIKNLFSKIWKIFQNIWYTLTGICDKIRTIWENIEYYVGVLQSDTFQKAFSLCKAELCSILSYIRPRTFQVDLTIGMDDPAATGKILSYYGMLYPLIGEHVTIVSDFERKRIEGSVLIKGKVKLFTFIKAAVRIYFSKDIRRLLSLFKKEESINGR